MADLRRQWVDLVGTERIGLLDEIMQKLAPRYHIKGKASPSDKRIHLKDLPLAAFKHFDFKAWTRRVRQFEKEQKEMWERAAKEREEKDRVANIQKDRNAELKADVTRARQMHKDKHGWYAGVEDIMQLILTPEFGDWGKPSKNKDVEITPHEVTVYCWAKIDRGGGFIDVSKLNGTTLLWEHVEELQPLEQTKDAEGRYRYRTNNKTVRKLRAARHCMLEAMIFATGDTLVKLNLAGFSTERDITAHEVMCHVHVLECAPESSLTHPLLTIACMCALTDQHEAARGQDAVLADRLADAGGQASAGVAPTGLSGALSSRSPRSSRPTGRSCWLWRVCRATRARWTTMLWCGTRGGGFCS